MRELQGSLHTPLFILLVLICKAVCYIDGEYTVKRVEMLDGRVRLMPANEQNTKYKPIEVQPENQFIIWGVVTYVIKKA